MPRIEEILAAHAARRADAVNLVASENRMSPAALRALGHDFAHRYAIPPRGERPPEIWDYPNQTHTRALEAETQRLACRLFGGGAANVRALSGNNIAGIILSGLVPAGGRAATVPGWAGGHFATVALAARLGVEIVDLPYDRTRRAMDLDACAPLAEAGVDLVYLDASMLLSPYPVRELRAIFGPATPIVYDASHVFGLIAGGAFQDPIGEGADAIVGSTHKSMFGPQKGLIVTAPGASDLAALIDGTVTPLFSSNPHVHHIAALGVALEELEDHGADYAAAVIANADRFARRLERNGMGVLHGPSGRATCHQVFAILDGVGAEDAMLRLEEANLHVNGVNLPCGAGEGLRIGLSEVTRLGLTPAEVETVADVVTRVLVEGDDPRAPRRAVAEIARRRPDVYYTADRPRPPAEAPAMARA